MKKYQVVIEEPAQTDVQRSYDWGCRVTISCGETAQGALTTARS